MGNRPLRSPRRAVGFDARRARHAERRRPGSPAPARLGRAGRQRARRSPRLLPGCRLRPPASGTQAPEPGRRPAGVGRLRPARRRYDPEGDPRSTELDAVTALRQADPAAGIPDGSAGLARPCRPRTGHAPVAEPDAPGGPSRGRPPARTFVLTGGVVAASVAIVLAGGPIPRSGGDGGRAYAATPGKLNVRIPGVVSYTLSLGPGVLTLVPGRRRR